MKPTGKRIKTPFKAGFFLPLLFLGVADHASIARAQSAGMFVATGNTTVARAGHTATLLLDGKVLITGGYSLTAPLASAELYDPSTGTFTATGNMTTARERHTATLLADGRILVAGGYNASADFPLRTAELYDPSTATFTATGDMIAGGRSPGVLLANGNVLIAGGGNAQLYDPATGAFTATGAYASTSPVFVDTTTLLPDSRVLITGDTAGCIGGMTELYDPVTGTFSLTGPRNDCDNRYKATLLLNGKVLFVGNVDSNYWAAAPEVYDPATGTFLRLGSISAPRASSTTTLLPDGRVLIAGGVLIAGHGDPSAELYAPADGMFYFATNMTTGRHSHTATLLPDGTVLIAGGVSINPSCPTDPCVLGLGDQYIDSIIPSNAGPISSAELYKPSLLHAAPVLFSLSGDGRSQGAILHPGTPHLASPSNPAVVGGALEIYGTGLVDGSVIPPQVAIGGRMAEILWFGQAPGWPSLNQVNVRVPGGVTPGPAIPVRLTYLGRPSNEVTIGVQ